jgi:hypothetical protein
MINIEEIKDRVERLHRWSKAVQEELRYLVDALSAAPDKEAQALLYQPAPAPAPEPEPALRSTAPKHEFKGLDCAIHGQSAHFRERHTLGKWFCSQCHMSP